VAANGVARGSRVSSDRLLLRGLGVIGLRMTQAQREALEVYCSELLRWAPQVNLTGLKSKEAIVREGFLRSLTFRTAFEPAPGMKAVDIGSGAGFPGLVLKICCPEIGMVLIEAIRRRATFLRHVIRQLGLAGVHCLHTRAEQLHGDPEHRERYQLAFARAIGALPDVVALAEPFLSPGGRLILQAGRKTVQSLQAASPRLTALGMSAAIHEAPAIDPGGPPTQLVVVDKARREVS
jgi:16S rRNA (guanine527-N7)-methyltransferase